MKTEVYLSNRNIVRYYDDTIMIGVGTKQLPMDFEDTLRKFIGIGDYLRVISKEFEYFKRPIKTYLDVDDMILEFASDEYGYDLIKISFDDFKVLSIQKTYHKKEELFDYINSMSRFFEIFDEKYKTNIHNQLLEYGEIIDKNIEVLGDSVQVFDNNFVMIFPTYGVVFNDLSEVIDFIKDFKNVEWKVSGVIPVINTSKQLVGFLLGNNVEFGKLFTVNEIDDVIISLGLNEIEEFPRKLKNLFDKYGVTYEVGILDKIVKDITVLLNNIEKVNEIINKNSKENSGNDKNQ